MTRDRGLGLLTAAFALAVAYALQGLGWLGGTENAVLGFCFRLRGERPPAAEIAIMAVEGGPWSQAYERHDASGIGSYGALVDRLHEAGAAVVVLDFPPPATLPDGGMSRQEIAHLAGAMRRARNVVLACVVRSAASTGVGRGSAVAARFSSGPGRLLMPRELRDGRLVLPPAALCEAAAGLGHLNIYPEPDGTIRSVPLLAEADGLLWPSLCLEAARVFRREPPAEARLVPGGVSLGDEPFSTTREAEMRINYYGGYKHFPCWSLSELAGLDRTALQERFEGKVVLVGPTSSDLTTLWRTPAHPVMPGVEINANAVANLLHHTELRRPGRAVPVLLALVAAALLGWVVPSLTATRGALFCAGVFVGVLVILVVTFMHGVWIPPSVPLVATALVGAVLTARMAVAADVRRAQAETSLESRLQAIAGIGGVVVSARDKAQLLGQVVRWVERELDVPAVSILLLDEHRRHLRFEVASGEKGAQVKALTVELGHGVAGIVAANGEPLIVNEASTDPRQARDISEAVGFPTESVVCVPMKLHDEVIGVIEALNKRSGPFTSRDQALLTVIAQQASLFLENAGLYSELQQRVEAATAELREANRSLASQKAKIETLVDDMEAGVIATDAADQVVMWNRAAERLLGVAESLALGQPVLSAVSHPQLLALFTMPLTPRGGRHEEEVELEVGGIPVVVRASINLIREANGGVGKLVLLTDITRLKDLDRMKTNLISYVSHELKNPLATIQGSAQVLERSLGEQVADDRPLRLLNQQVVRMQLLVDDYLDVTRIEAGIALELHRIQINDLRGVIQAVVDLAALTAASHTFVVDVATDLPPVVADRSKLEQVLANLVSNAVKYSPEGGEVRTTARKEGEELFFAVSDEGLGIRPSDAPNLFRMFERAREAPHRVEGTGIGLFLSRHLVEAHGGRIWMEPREKGTTFRFTLPLLPPEEAGTDQDAATDPPEAG